MSRASLRTAWLLAAWLFAAAGGAAAADPAGDDDGSVHDPWETMNRGIFSFNEGFDRWIFEPVAKGWDFVMPDPVERSVENFFDNLDFPILFANDLLQGKPVAAVTDIGRFMVNTTIGIGGLFDPATSFLRMPKSDEDFGQTLGVWGVPAGPYLVLPLLGASNPRDTVGFAVDTASRVQTYFVPFYVNIASTLVVNVNRRALLLETISEERKSAFDFYVAVRNAYVQRRESQIADQAPKSEESDDDLYEVGPIDDVQ
jgi:phospholipid-binding lipoprotein MlaA